MSSWRLRGQGLPLPLGVRDEATKTFNQKSPNKGRWRWYKVKKG